ncbi:putative F-box protein At3g16210 [Papaver somniferum]|uniref:putative F-box protein At3g16210 n=1 Tax=Papaver somniferum TaxID=3469 RepID=UPI000E6FC0A0|nr:putative F-box protein At3g16210 [Papaver somniferum]
MGISMSRFFQKRIIVCRFNIFPEEIMFEILSRVPAEYVINCKSVCKRWRDLVRHPSFSQLHFNNLDFGKSSFICFDYDMKEFSYAEYDENCLKEPLSRETRMNLNLPSKDYVPATSCNAGFGYSPSTNEYKVVRICDSRRDSKVGKIQVHTLGSGSGWRNVGTMDIDKEYHKYTGAFVDEALHWVDSVGTILRGMWNQASGSF